MTSWGAHVAAALRAAAITELDDRGLMPLERARAVLAATTAVERGEVRDVGGVVVRDADIQWAALLSLADAAEATAEAGRLVWRDPPAVDDIALVERYGDGLLGWLESRVRDRVMINQPRCVRSCLLALDDLDILALLWMLRGYRDASGEAEPPPGDPADEAAAADALRDRWIDTHRAIALPWLVAAAERGDARAVATLNERARRTGPRFVAELAADVGDERAAALALAHGWPQALTAATIVATLDAGCERSWPEFSYAVDGRHEYFALRLIAVRDRRGDGWGLVLERLGGGDPGALRVDRHLHGSAIGPDTRVQGIPVALEVIEPRGAAGAPRHLFHGGIVRGPATDVVLDEALIDELDLRPGLCCEVALEPLRIAAIRAYLALVPGALWPDPADAVARLGLVDPEILLVTESFRHVTGPFERNGVPQRGWEVAPSASPAYRSLAEALVARDPARFEPGETNLDWRWHAVVDVPCALPWRHARVDRAAGDLAAAMREAAVRPDGRGLMPLADARDVVATATRFAKGTGRWVDDTWVQDSDRLWAALLSLDSGDELAAEIARLDWLDPPRGDDNLAPVQRYGAGILAWARAMVDDSGVLHMRPACLRANLLAVDDEDVIELLGKVTGVRGTGAGDPEAQRILMIDAWRAARHAK